MVQVRGVYLAAGGCSLLHGADEQQASRYQHTLEVRANLSLKAHKVTTTKLKKSSADSIDISTL